MTRTINVDGSPKSSHHTRERPKIPPHTLKAVEKGRNLSILSGNKFSLLPGRDSSDGGGGWGGSAKCR